MPNADLNVHVSIYYSLIGIVVCLFFFLLKKKESDAFDRMKEMFRDEGKQMSRTEGYCHL